MAGGEYAAWRKWRIKFWGVSMSARLRRWLADVKVSVVLGSWTGSVASFRPEHKDWADTPDSIARTRSNQTFHCILSTYLHTATNTFYCDPIQVLSYKGADIFSRCAHTISACQVIFEGTESEFFFCGANLLVAHVLRPNFYHAGELPENATVIGTK